MKFFVLLIIAAFCVIANAFTLNMVKIGDIAPPVELKNFEGKTFNLQSFKGKKPVVVFFYPADNTPGCTKEACAFEKRAPDFASKGAEVTMTAESFKCDTLPS